MSQILKLTIAILAPLLSSIYYSSYDLMSYFIGGMVVLSFMIIDDVHKWKGEPKWKQTTKFLTQIQLA